MAPSERAVQIWDPLDVRGLVNMVACGKYLALRTRSQRESGIGIEAPSLVHEDSLVSMPSGGYAQPSSLFGKRDCLPVNSVASPVMVGVSPEEVIA